MPLAAAGLVVAALGWKPLRATLESRPCSSAGSISFSLYLVHVPILIFSTYLFAGSAWYVGPLFGMPVAVIVAVGFTWLVEQRSHGWSKAAGAWASNATHLVRPGRRGRDGTEQPRASSSRSVPTSSAEGARR